MRQGNSEGKDSWKGVGMGLSSDGGPSPNAETDRS